MNRKIPFLVLESETAHKLNQLIIRTQFVLFKGVEFSISATTSGLPLIICAISILFEQNTVREEIKCRGKKGDIGKRHEVNIGTQERVWSSLYAFFASGAKLHYDDVVVCVCVFICLSGWFHFGNTKVKKQTFASKLLIHCAGRDRKQLLIPARPD